MTMTTEEMAALETTATLFNQISKLDDDGKHPYDVPEVVFHIHSIQRIIMARSVRRSLPGTFNQVATPAAPPRSSVVHGRSCHKVEHKVRGEFSHGALEDGPYAGPDGVYCGRCHELIDRVPE